MVKPPDPITKLQSDRAKEREPQKKHQIAEDHKPKDHGPRERERHKPARPGPKPKTGG